MQIHIYVQAYIYKIPKNLTLRQFPAAHGLVRCPHIMEGSIPPADSIPMAEKPGLIQPLSRWVLE